MNEESATAVLHRAVALFHSGARHECVESLERATREHPDEGCLWELLGVVHHAGREFTAAQEALETASTLAPLTPDGQVALADCFVRSGSPKAARTIYQHLAASGDLRTDLLSHLAKRLAAFGEFRLALDVCRLAARREPDCPEAIYGMAYYMGKCGYPADRVLTIAERAFRLAPDTLAYRLAVAMLHHRLGRTDEARRLLRSVSPSQIATVRCATCVQRVLEIFEQGRDDHRREVWLRHLYDLREHDAKGQA